MFYIILVNFCNCGPAGVAGVGIIGYVFDVFLVAGVVGVYWNIKIKYKIWIN